MKILCDAGIVAGRKEGKWMHYRICCDGVCALRSMLQELLSPEMLPKDCNCKE
jgi:ArsR family transcriptional regulator